MKNIEVKETDKENMLDKYQDALNRHIDWYASNAPMSR